MSFAAPLSSSQRFVTFSKMANARTGNILFQYLFCVRISLLYGHAYVAIEDIDMANISKDAPLIKITDSNLELIKNVKEYDAKIRSSHILCEGFFQQNHLYLFGFGFGSVDTFRLRILEYLQSTNDSWIGFSGKREYIRDFLTSQYSIPNSLKLTKKDIVMSLRLDDFIQLPNARSDILPPQYYTDILEKWFSKEERADGRLIIVSDQFRHYWEHKYLEYFSKWSPIIMQNTLLEDFALMRDCPTLIHSNSSLCWFASFLSDKKMHRFIPKTDTYSSQHLEEIDYATDIVVQVKPMEHSEVYALNVMCWHRDLNSFAYCVPDELCLDEFILPLEKKKYVISPLIPGDKSNYLFGAGEEAKYYDMYRQSMFAITQKKGGWDCLRHYEIISAGCIPIFEDLEKCPEDTLISFPKSILKEAYRALLPWRNTEEQRSLYPMYARRLFEYAKSNCSATANVVRFLGDMSYLFSNNYPNNNAKILMLSGHLGVNYTRELNWIGIKRWASNVGAVAVEYPPLEFLYDDFPESRLSKLYGNGFTYTRRLSSQTRVEMREEELIQSIRQKKWDIIIYGKVGPDEMAEGSIPNLPFWSHVFKRYSRDEIVFWYGGDGMQDMTYANRYSDHLVRHCQYARCFVRELIKWDGTFK
jgi:hypothetical protein